MPSRTDSRTFAFGATENEVTELPEGFLEPGPEYRPWPFFILSDEFEPEFGEERVTRLLEALVRVGYGGVFIHPRPGLITEYLSARWFEIVRHTIRECRRLGLIPNLYDENSYPSGFAGGHVPAQAPGTAALYVAPKWGKWPDQPPRGAVAVYRLENNVVGSLLQSGEHADEWLAFVIERMPAMPWHGGFPYVSLLESETTEVFLRTTHERYRNELGDDLWGACAAMFTDEPHLVGGLHGPAAHGLPFSRHVQAEFRARHGYGIEERIIDLYACSSTAAATRHDFFETLHALWFENFARPLVAWCRRHGIALTGHYLEHDWPAPWATPGHVHLLAQMDWPGTDLLECFLLEGHDYGDPQNLDPAPAGVEPHALYYLRQVQSLANQLGKDRVVNECWGGGGHDSAPRDWLRIGRYLAVHGVNLFVPHYSTVTIRGARKCDHPPFFSPQSPWFDALRPLNDELARLSWLVAGGRMDQRVLLLDPLTTAYCLAAKSGSLPVEASSPRAEGPESVNHLRRKTTEFAQLLSDAQCDFDIGDEYVLEEHASVSGPTLSVGRQTYRAVVFPPGFRNLRKPTRDLLMAFAEAGGMLFAHETDLPLWLEGRPASWAKELRLRCYAETDQLLSALFSEVRPRVRFLEPQAAGLAHQRRERPEGIFYLFVNSGSEAVDCALELEEDGQALWLDPASGTSAPFEGTLHLEPSAAGILWVGKNPGSLPRKAPRAFPSARRDSAANRLRFLRAERCGDNIMVLDACALQTSTQRFPPQLVYESNRCLWQANGMPVNGWFGVVQFRSELLDANRRMQPDSGGVARYTVHISPQTPVESIQLATECASLWKIRVNGQPAATQEWEEWRDPRIFSGPIGHWLRAGENIVELESRPFDVRHEIDQIYLLGDFVLEPIKQGFCMAPKAPPLGLGSWRALGMPFFDGKVSYYFENPGTPTRLRIPRTEWHGACMEITLGSFRCLHYGPDVVCDIPKTDATEIEVTVTGLPFNLFGPWHKPGLLPKHGWSTFWHGGDIPNAPQPGQAYHLLDLGLFMAPEFS